MQTQGPGPAFGPTRSALLRAKSGLLVAAIVLFGFALTSILVADQQARVERDLRARFERLSERIELEVERRLRLPLYGLKGARGVFAASSQVRRAEFRDYVESRQMAVEFPGVRGFGFIARVLRPQLAEFEAATRRDDAPDFAVRSGGAEADLFVVKYIEPVAQNHQALGFDIGQESIRREAIERALRSGHEALSGRISLVQDEASRSGFLLLLPIYKRGSDPQSALEREHALLGFVFAPLVAAELLSGADAVADGLLDFELVDSPADEPASLAYRFGAEAVNAAGGPALGAARFKAERKLDFAGRSLTIVTRSNPEFERLAHTGSVVWSAAGGGLLTLLLAFSAWLLSTGRERAEARAAAMTVDLERLARVARGTSNAVIASDTGGRITWVNEGFSRISGYAPAEAIGRRPAELMGCVTWAAATEPNQPNQPDESDESDELAAMALSRSGRRREFQRRRASGELYWVDADVQPVFDAGGQHSGFIEISLDISERKLSQQALAEQQASLNRIIEGTNAGTWDWNVVSGEVALNERWAEMLGYSLAELVELAPIGVNTWTDSCHPDDLPKAQALLLRHFMGETDFYECELRMRHRDGHWVWVLAHGKLYARTVDGEPLWIAGTHMDISGAKTAAELLQHKQLVLDRAERLAGLGAWEINLATQALTWSPQTYRLHDLAPDLPINQAQALSHFSAADRALLEEAMELALRTGRPWDLVLRLNTALGRFLSVRSVGEAVFDEGGVARRLVGTYQDVTQQRLLEDAQRRSNELLNIVLESLPCGLTVIDAGLNVVLHNGRYAELYGLDADFLTAAPLTVERVARLMAERGEYGAIDVDAALAAANERAVAAVAAPHQWARCRPNGLSLEMRSNPLPSGGFVTTYMDVGERDRAEAEVRRAGLLLRGAIDAVNEAFVLYGPDDRLVFCNEKYRQMYAASADLIVPGASFEAIIRGGAARGQYLDAEGRIEDWVAERLALHRRSDSMLVQKLDDGRWVRVIERKMPDGHTVGFRIDITDLVLANEAAQDASRSKSRFLANMSHEIRTPMNAILGMLSLLQKTGLNARQHDYASKTEGAARSLLGLLNDILDFSKVEAGKMVLDPQPFRVEQLFRDLSVILSANVGPKPLELLFDIDPALPAVLSADAPRLQQVLINLGGNAIKFTPRGEVVVSARLLARRADEVEIEFAVSDSGIGIAAEHQALIFSGFSQAEASTTRRFGGTGLGLAICQRLVQLMGGELTLQSAPGKGSCFSFTLRVASVETSPEPGLPLRALIVDDNAIALDVLGHMSEALGWQVDLAPSGAAALALMAGNQPRQIGGAQPYEVVLVDWQMPDMDGFETAQRIRALAGAQAPPVLVMVSAHGRELLAQRSPEEQGLLDGFLVKPVTALMLQEAVLAARGGVAAYVPAAAAVAYQPLQGLRILVVEDNLNNQQVAQELLEDAGARVQLADNGQLGVDLLRADGAAFDIVLMDLQMPVMDGYGATRAIRHELGLTRLPIVAMTANAMAADREACLAAGMNEHVGKPFELAPLVELLLRLTARTAVAGGGRLASLSVPAGLREQALAEGIDLQAAMDRFMGKTDLFRRMVGAFVESARALPAQLKTEPADQAAMALHSFKGLAGTLGASRLAALGQAGEALLKRGTGLDTGWLGELDRQIQGTCHAMLCLADSLSDLSPAPAGRLTPTDAQAFKAGLLHMMQLLRDFDMGAIDAFAQLRHAAPLGAQQEALADVDQALAGLDFERALTLCEALLGASST